MGGASVKNNEYVVFCIKMIVLSVFGLSTLPFLAGVVKYLDSVVGIDSSSGYYTDATEYIFRSPLIYMLVVLCANIIVAGGALILINLKKKK